MMTVELTSVADSQQMPVSLELWQLLSSLSTSCDPFPSITFSLKLICVVVSLL